MHTPLFRFAICGRAETPVVAARFRPTHLVTFIDPGDPRRVPARPDTVAPQRHLILECRDTPAGFVGSPTSAIVHRLLEMTRLLQTGDRPLFQCEAGIARSPAAALVALSQHLGPERADTALARVLEAQPFAWPNPEIVRIAADFLNHPDLVRVLNAFKQTAIRTCPKEIF